MDAVRAGRRAALAIGLLLALCAGRAHAIVGHYTAGLPNVHDYFIPPAGLYYAQYFYFYTTDTFKDRNGDSIDSVTIRRGPAAGTVLDLDLNLNQYVIAPTIMWSPDWSWHGIRYGAYAVIPLANANLSAAIQNVDNGVDTTFGWGLSDIFIQPLWLQYSTAQSDVSFGYGFVAPVGRFEQGATDNLGLGFWTQQLQLAGEYYFDRARTFSIIGVQTWEFNSRIRDSNVRPGSRLTFNWAINKSWLDGMLETAITGYDQWQINADSGPIIARIGAAAQALDEIHAAGVQLGIPKLGVSLKYLHEFAARQRFQGQVVTFTFGLPLDPLIEKLAGLAG